MPSERILVVEDEADILEIIAYNLTREGFKVISSRDGEQGLRLARIERPDLILLDLMLPSLDGLEICRVLKGDSATVSTPIIGAQHSECVGFPAVEFASQRHAQKRGRLS